MAKPTIQDAVNVRRAVESLLKGFEGVVRVEAALGPDGPEVRVIVEPRVMKKLRGLLPVEKQGVAVRVQVRRH